MNLKPGMNYIAHRQEILNPKPKFHLYLCHDIVFLINSEKDIFDFSINLQKEDCAFFTKNCYLQVKQFYKFDTKQKIIRMEEMSNAALERLNSYLKDKNIKKTIPKKYVDRAIGILEQCLQERAEREIKIGNE